MALESCSTGAMAEALAMMYALHRDQCRKGPDKVPYITHLMGVAALVGEYGGDEEQMIAGLLHDAAEDQGGEKTLDRIREAFGERVARMVAACSDTFAEEKPPWRERKERHIAHTFAASPEIKLVMAADKLYNLVSLRRALRIYGSGIWEAFKGGRAGSLWYYREMRRALGEGWDHPILAEIDEQLRSFAQEEPEPIE